MPTNDLAALSDAANHNTPEGHKAYEMFCAAAWNEYRAGRLVHIDREGMRERVAELQLAAFLAGRGSIVTKADGRTRESKPGPTMDDYRSMADAAIAEMLGDAA